jgi:hypothetical protein
VTATIRTRVMWWLAIIALQITVVFAAFSVFVHFQAAKMDVRVTRDSIWDWTALDGLTTRKRVSTELMRPDAFAVHLDSRGARVPARSVETPDTVDVMVIGCSFAFGWGVNEGDTFPALLREDLHVRVANLGIPGTGTVSALRSLERNRDLSPRVIVYTFIADHVRRNLAPCAPLPTIGCVSVPYVDWVANEPRIVAPVGTRADFDAALRLNHMIAANRTIDAPVLAFRFLQGLAWLLSHNLLGRNPDNAANVSAHGDATLDFLLSRIADEARRLGAVAVFLHVPDQFPTAVPVPESIVAALPPGVVLVDAAPALNAYGETSGQPLSVSGDGHPNATAHRIIERALEPVLTKLLAETNARRPSSQSDLAECSDPKGSAAAEPTPPAGPSCGTAGLVASGTQVQREHLP